MLPHPIDPATARARDLEAPPARALRRSRGAAPAARRLRDAGGRPDGGRARSATRASSRRPTGRARRGSCSCRDESVLADAFELALDESRSSVVLVEELVPGREVTVNAFSIDGRFTPLTVTDRVVAEPPAFGVALAHVWPSSLLAAERRQRRRGGPRGRGSARHRGTGRRIRRSWSASAARSSSSSPRGSAAVTTRSSARGDRRRPERPRARRRARRAGRRRRSRVGSRRAAPASASSSPAPGELRAGRGSRGGRGGRRRRLGARLPRAGRDPGAAAPRADRAGAVLAVGGSRDEARRARWPRGRAAYASVDCRCPRSCRPSARSFLGFQPPAVGEEEVAAVAETLRSGWLTTGPRAAELERRFAEYVGAQARAGGLLGHGGDAPRARRARGRPRRRGDHDADHLAGDGERRSSTPARRRSSRTSATAT